MALHESRERRVCHSAPLFFSAPISESKQKRNGTQPRSICLASCATGTCTKRVAVQRRPSRECAGARQGAPRLLHHVPWRDTLYMRGFFGEASKGAGGAPALPGTRRRPRSSKERTLNNYPLEAPRPPFAVAFRGHCRSDLRNPSKRQLLMSKIDLRNPPNAVTQPKARPGQPMPRVVGERLSSPRFARSTS